MKRTGLKRGAGLSRPNDSLDRGKGLRPDPEKVRAFMKRHRGGGFKKREPLPPEVVAEAFARSDNRCINCGTRTKYLHPHHFLDVNSFPELQILVDNIGALCPRCHMNHHYAPHGKVTWDRLPACVLRLAEREGRHALLHLERVYPKEKHDA